MKVTDFLDEWNKTHTSNPSFQDAIDWADRTMLARICKWLENHIFDFPWYDNEHSDFSSKDVVNALRKAIEE